MKRLPTFTLCLLLTSLLLSACGGGGGDGTSGGTSTLVGGSGAGIGVGTGVGTGTNVAPAPSPIPTPVPVPAIPAPDPVPTPVPVPDPVPLPTPVPAPSSGSGSGAPIADVTRPTVVISDNVIGGIANGPVVFTFTFSEDVGTSFSFDDIVVSGGTAGTFARQSSTLTTLSVVPNSGSTGTIGLSVSASSYSDLAGNQNATAVTATRSYDTRSADVIAMSRIVPLFDASTVLETSMVEDTGAALITRFGDRARDRHAREGNFHIYDHYLSWYWEQRTATVEIIDKVAKGGTEIVFNIYPQWALSAPEFRAFFRGVTTAGEYHTNISMARIGTTPYHYTTTLTFNPKNNRPIQNGDRLELEISQFLASPTHGRSNYYGTAVLYIVGQGGLVPWEGQGANLDSFPLPAGAWSGGRTTLPYQYSNEPLERFKQISGHLAAGSAQPFMLGRRLHHTDFGTGAHSEFPDENPIYTEQVGKLGPQFYAASCVACHLNNGRAIPPGPNVIITNAVTKIGTASGAHDPQLGGSLQPLRLVGATTQAGEGSIKIDSYTLTNGSYVDGTPYQLRKPNYAFVGPVPPNFSLRNTPPLVGLGLLEAVAESTINAMADPTDANHDGISGRVQTVVDPETGQIRLGRFGWKAGQARIKHQIAIALNADMGITNSVFQQHDCGSAQSGCGTAGVKLNDADLANMVRYVSLLGVAARRNLNDAQAIQGEAAFNVAGCGGCHRATLATSSQHPFAELRSQTISPYTDLLLHDMGAGLADNLPEANASGAEWRTAPLWSLGLTAGVAGGQEAYLHDGRARDLSEAILWHGGEAEAAKEAFRAMSVALRAALIKFIQSL